MEKGLWVSPFYYPQHHGSLTLSSNFSGNRSRLIHSPDAAAEVCTYHTRRTIHFPFFIRVDQMRSFPLIYSVALLFFVGKSNVLVRGFSIDPKTPKSSLFHKQMKANPSEPTFPGISSLECRQLVESSCTTSSLQLSGGANGDIEPSKPTLVRELIAEFIGTFIIVQLGCGTVCAAVFKAAQVGLWQIAAAWTIAVTLAISTTASVSGAHLNPAITLSLALLRGFSWIKVPTFIAAQVAGAVVAAGVNFALFRDSIAAFEATNNIVRGSIESVQSASAFGEYWSVSSVGTAFFAEAYGTAMLAFVIFALTNPKNEISTKHSFLVPPLIGATVGGLISVIAPLTQAGFNPARDFGPRIIAAIAGWGSIAMKGWWLYVIAPIVGAPIGAWVADKVLYPED